MDSMKSLNKSLPTSSPRNRSIPPPEQLLQDFRYAALSVTNLYKTAVKDQLQARRTGYQDALDDLLTLLDKENIGLGDGEGWRIRQWATKRLDNTIPPHTGSESEDDRAETEKRAGSPSPVLQQKDIPKSSQPRPPSRSSSPLRPEDPPEPIPNLSAQQHPVLHAQSGPFNFRSVHQLPVEMDTQPPENASTPTSEVDPTHPVQTSSTQPPFRVEIMSRTRNPNRHSSHPGRHNTRSAMSLRSLGGGAGSKRRVTFGDFFDIGTLGDGRDASGGTPKRSRLN